MPIRLNLLAEYHAAEEAKRKDPIKRSIYAGVILTILVFLWIGSRQMSIRAARAELVVFTNKLFQVEEKASLVKTNQEHLLLSERRINSLIKYSTNRFLWGTFLEALQEATHPDIRLMDVKTNQKYTTNAPVLLLETNIYVKWIPPPGKWKFWKWDIWGFPQISPPYLEYAAKEYKHLTNKPPFITNHFPITIKAQITDTNIIGKQVIVKANFSTVPFSIEQTEVTIMGRDYGQPVGNSVSEFSQQVRNSAYFKENLQHTHGVRLLSQKTQPQKDPTDPVSPEASYVSFTIELSFKERTFTNE